MAPQSWMTGSDRVAAVIRRLPDGVVALDRTATILWASDAADALVGFRPDELVGRNGLDLIDPRDVETAASALLRTLDSCGQKEPWPLRVVGSDGASRWVEMLPVNLLDDPAIEAILLSVRSLEGRFAVEAEARTIEELFRRAFDDAPIGMALLSPAQVFTRVNTALCELLRRAPLELLGVDVRALTHADDVDGERALTEALLAGDRRSYALDKRFLRPDGSVVWVGVGVSLVRTDDGQPERFVMHMQDINDRKASEAVLAYRATHDALTGMPNRALFDDRLAVALARSRRMPTSVAVLFCDLDGFKGVNDRLGHDAGDIVLAQVALRLQGAVRPGDTVARFGGDEFVVLCEDLVADRDLDAIAARMVRAVGRPIRVAGEDVSLGLSVGTALSTGRESASDLLRLADAAMYEAKAAAQA